MSVVIARDQTAADNLIYGWPYPVPHGAELLCGEDEAIVLCSHGVVGDQLGPGSHHLQAPHPEAQITAFFIKLSPMRVGFEMGCEVPDLTAGRRVRVDWGGGVYIRTGDARLLCHELVPLPTPNINGGALRSVARSVNRVFRTLIRRHPSVSGLAGHLPELMDAAISLNPVAGAVGGVEFIGFDEVAVTVDGRTARWTPQATGAAGTGSQPDLEPPAAVSGEIRSGEVVAGELGAGNAQSQPAAPASDPAMTLPAGTRVLVFWSDGLWHSAIVRGFEQGRYEIALGDGTETAWVQADAVRPE